MHTNNFLQQDTFVICSIREHAICFIRGHAIRFNKRHAILQHAIEVAPVL